MESNSFYRLREQLLQDALNVTKAKGKDYTKGSNDALRNFKETGVDLGIEPIKVWGIFAKKHWDAIMNFIKTNGQSQSEPIRNRIIDLINYLCLLEGLLNDADNFVWDNKTHESA